MKDQSSHSVRSRAPSPRVACSLKKQCGLCPDVNEPYSQTLPIKVEQELKQFKQHPLFENTKFLPAVASPRELGYRCVAKLAVQPDHSGEFKIGLYTPGTHDVISIEQCPLHVEAIRNLLPELTERLNHSSLTPWNGETGDIRYLVIRASHLTKELMVTFITQKDCKRDLVRIVRGLQRSHIASVYQSVHKPEGNGIFGETPRHLAGAPGLRESVCDLAFQLGPQTFFQVNPWVASQIYRRIEHIAGNGNQLRAWDLYSGCGPISMVLARAGYQVTGVEENIEAVESAEKNLLRNQLKARFIPSRVENTILADSPSLIVTNPSRRGMASGARQWLKEAIKTHRCPIVYMSCNADTLIRDLEDICETGYQVRQIEAFDMFPQTGHFEWLTVLSI